MSEIPQRLLLYSEAEDYAHACEYALELRALLEAMLDAAFDEELPSAEVMGEALYVVLKAKGLKS